MRAAAFVLAAFALCFPAPARAQGRRLKPAPRRAVNLTYEVARGLSCPNEKGLRLAVRSELGYDPFVDDPAPLRFKLSIARRGGKLGAVMELRDDQGALVKQDHDIFVEFDCKLLVDMVGDTVGGWLYRPPEAEPCPTCPSCPPPPEPPPPPPPPAGGADEAEGGGDGEGGGGEGAARSAAPEGTAKGAGRRGGGRVEGAGAEEKALIKAARRAWEVGEVDVALVNLAAHERQFPEGALAQERERLRGEVMGAVEAGP